MGAALEKILVAPGSGKGVGIPGSTESTFKVLGDQTSGAFSLVESVIGPGFFAAPHLHERFTEVSYVLDGELGVLVAEEEFQAATGSFVIRPKGVPHAFWNTEDRPVKLLDIFTPAGHEAFFESVSKLFSGSAPPTLQRLADIGRANDVIFLPDLAAPLMQKYRLRMPG